MLTNKQVAIFGAGMYGEIVFKFLKLKGYEVIFFIDQLTEKKEYMGKPVYRIEDVILKNIPIYIGVSHSNLIIEEKLKNSGFSLIIPYFILKDEDNSLPPYIPDDFDISDDFSYIDNDKVNKVLKFFTDSKSLELYKYILELRRDKTFKEIKSNIFYDPNCYTPKDVPIFQRFKKLRIADCGAFTGDSILNFLKLKQKVEFIALFEPIPKNLNILHDNIKIFTSKYNEIIIAIFPLGVSEKPGIEEFCDMFSFSRISNNKTVITNKIENIKEKYLLPITTLDETLYGSKINFIKMDIEGSEYNAIKGAINLIKDYKPDLAISIYHNPSDLWDIPILIKSINNNYKMYIRSHHSRTPLLDLVLYCTI